MNIKIANLFTMFTIISLVIPGVRNIEWEHFDGNKFLCDFFIFLFKKNWHVEKVVKSIYDWIALFAIVSNKSAKIEWSEALITVQTWAQNLITSFECIKGFNIEFYEFWHEIHFKWMEMKHHIRIQIVTCMLRYIYVSNHSQNLISHEMLVNWSHRC